MSCTSFPQDLDMDRVLYESLSGVVRAVTAWLSGAPTSEEPLMNRLTAEFTRRRRRCDVGTRTPVVMTGKYALLHRRGESQTDAYGADLAVTVDIPDRAYTKTALFQIKVSADFALRLEREQLDQAMRDARTEGRSFVLAADKSRERLRIKSVVDALHLVSANAQTASIDCAEWSPLGDWLVKWLSCDVGQPSRLDDTRSVEALLQHFVVEPPPNWESPWGDGNAEDYPEELRPAKAWLELFFRQSASRKQ